MSQHDFSSLLINEPSLSSSLAFTPCFFYSPQHIRLCSHLLECPFTRLIFFFQSQSNDAHYSYPGLSLLLSFQNRFGLTRGSLIRCLHSTLGLYCPCSFVLFGGNKIRSTLIVSFLMIRKNSLKLGRNTEWIMFQNIFCK